MEADAAFLDAITARIPMGRRAAASEFAGIAAYLMSDSSSYHTGDCLTLDGGFTLS